MSRSDLVQFGLLAGAVTIVVIAVSLGSRTGSEEAERPADGVQMGISAGTVVRAAMPVEALSYDTGAAVESESGLTVRGAPAVKSLRCDDPGVLRIETVSENILATIVSARDWDCGAALGRWVATTPPDAAVGVQVEEGGRGADPSITLLNDRGGSLNLRVTEIRQGA